MIEGQKESVDEFIIRLCTKIKGVGKAIAGTVANDFESDVNKFLEADKGRFNKIIKSNSKPVLTSYQIEELISIKKIYPQKRTIQELWVFHLGREFLVSQVEMIRKLNFEHFDINPLLAIALNLDTPEKIVTFNVYQTVTRSIVTSWGYTVQNIGKFVGLCKTDDFIIEGKTGTKFDLVKSIKGVDHHIQLKSGPNDMNVGMVTSLNEAIEKLEKDKKGSVGMLGITYGTRKSLSNQITGNLIDPNKRIWIGRELWDTIGEDKDFHIKLFELLDLSSRDLLQESFTELIEAKITELKIYWESNFANLSINQVLDKYI